MGVVGARIGALAFVALYREGLQESEGQGEEERKSGRMGLGEREKEEKAREGATVKERKRVAEREGAPDVWTPRDLLIACRW